MNRKIFDMAILIISAAGTILALVDPTIEAFSNEFDLGAMETFSSTPIVNIVIKVSLIAIVVICVVFVKKQFTDLFDVLFAMAENNKLHPLRELVMVKHTRMEAKNNKLRVNKAIFKYTVSPSKSCTNQNNPEVYDVRYSLSFQLSKPRLIKMMDQNRMFSFYLIGKEENQTGNFDVKMKIDGKMQEISAIVKRPTIRGISGDQNESIATLYEVQIILPHNISHQNILNLCISYDLLEDLSTAVEQYCFFIIPQNYGKKVEVMEIQIDAPVHTLYHPELQRVGPKGDWDLVEIFSPKEEDGRALCEKTIRPDMKSAYFVQFDMYDRFAVS